MLTDLKLTLTLELHVWRKHIEEKAKKRWYYNYLPKRIARAFTLAEVLITLTIIGLVASLTIPSLINNIGDQQNKVAWRKTFATLSQATSLVLSDNSGILLNICPHVNWEQDSVCIMKKYESYLNYTKSCYANFISEKCWHGYDTVKYINGSLAPNGEITPNSGNYPGMILNNGILLIFPYGRTDLSQINIFVDVNGFKGPNTYGKDIYFTYVNNNKIFPGVDSTLNDSSCDTNGYGCSIRYLYQ